jgi:hypothetical protein
MADLNKLAVLINQHNSDISAVANAMQIDVSIIDAALNYGENVLDRNDRLELEEKLARYERIELSEYEQAELEDYTNNLDEIESAIDDFRNGNTLRQCVAFDKIDLTDLDDFDLLMKQGVMTLSIQNRIIDWLIDNEHNATSFLDAFRNDDYRIDGITESEFWAWYRETFY